MVDELRNSISAYTVWFLYEEGKILGRCHLTSPPINPHNIKLPLCIYTCSQKFVITSPISTKQCQLLFLSHMQEALKNYLIFLWCKVFSHRFLIVMDRCLMEKTYLQKSITINEDTYFDLFHIWLMWTHVIWKNYEFKFFHLLIFFLWNFCFAFCYENN